MLHYGTAGSSTADAIKESVDVANQLASSSKINLAKFYSIIVFKASVESIRHRSPAFIVFLD